MMLSKNVDELIAELSLPNPLTRMSAQKQLIRLGDRALGALVSTLRVGDDMQRAHAAIVLGELGDIRALDTLLDLRQHGNTLLRIDCAKSLGALSSPRALAALLDWLETEENVLVQTAIVQTLSALRLPQTNAHLVQALERTPSPSLKYLIIRVLGELGNPNAIDIIFPYADNLDHHIQREALIALEKLSANREKAREL